MSAAAAFSLESLVFSRILCGEYIYRWMGFLGTGDIMSEEQFRFYSTTT